MSMPLEKREQAPMMAQMTEMALTRMSLANGALARPKYPTRDDVAYPRVRAPSGTIAWDSTADPPR